MKRRVVSIILMMTLLFAMCGCSQNNQSAATSQKESGSDQAGNESSQPDANQTEPQKQEHIVADWAKDAVIYEVNIRQYTSEGTFEAFSKHLERLHNMGVSVLWLMPIFPKGTNWADVASLNYENQDMRRAMLDAMGYWVDTYGIDGFRCDYAGGVPTDFWEEARTELNHRAEQNQTSELFWLAEDNTNTKLLENAFDANYNWNLYDTLRKIVKGGKKSTSIKHYIGDNYPDGSFPMNFLDNHDKNSYEGTIAENFGEDAMSAMMTLIYTLPGIPMLYSGDEAGLDHALEFFEKDEIIWPKDLPYEKILTRLAQIRSQHSSLYSGTYGGEIQIIDVGNPYIFAFTRTREEEQITVILNLSDAMEEADLSTLAKVDMTQLLHGYGAKLLETEEKTMTQEEITAMNALEPWEFWIISSK